MKKITKYLVISSKNEKWDLYFTKSQGAKILYLKWDTSIPAINSLPATEKYETFLTSINKNLKKLLK